MTIDFPCDEHETRSVNQQGGTTSAPIKLVLAFDHVILREGLLAIFASQNDMKVVAECSNGSEAVKRWLEIRPDVLVVDASLPKLCGVNTIRRVRNIDAAAKIVVLTRLDGDVSIHDCIQAGASAYMLDHIGGQELLETIRAVWRGCRPIRPEIAARMATYLQSPSLTDREREYCSTSLEDGQIAASQRMRT